MAGSSRSCWCRVLLPVLLLLACLAGPVGAWTTEDYEIFEVSARLERVGGKGADFYSFLQVPNGIRASVDDINRAYRQRSRELHPDKNPGIPKANERFSTLGLVTQILRNPETRIRYDHFYKNGFPVWRGTGYLYARWRPGINSVIILLILLSAAAQYVGLKLTVRQRRKLIRELTQDARALAWTNGIPVSTDRKVTLEDTGRQFLVKPDGRVFYLAGPGDSVELIAEDIPDASINQVFIVSLPRWFLNELRNDLRGDASPRDDRIDSDRRDDSPPLDKSEDDEGTQLMADKVETEHKAGRRRKNRR